MVRMSLPLIASLALATLVGGARRQENVASPINRVVKMLEEMKREVESEAEKDEEVYKKHACWCETNGREKAAAIEAAKKKITDLTAFIEEGSAKAQRLDSEVAGIQEELTTGQESLQKAEGVREKELETFKTEEAEAKETLGALKQATEILSKVQLAQTGAAPQPPAEAFIQVRQHLAVVQRSAPAFLSTPELRKFNDVMTTDLWDILGSMRRPSHQQKSIELDQQPTGAAAGAKSYNSQSGQILGMLDRMKDETHKSLTGAHLTEMTAAVSFQEMKAAKTGEIVASSDAFEAKTEALADTNQQVAQAKEELADTQKQLTADEEFVVNMKERCAEADKGYEERVKTRSDEAMAITKTIQILTEDSARDTFSSTYNLLQKSSMRSRNFNLRSAAAAKLLQMGRSVDSSHAWQLATLSASVKLAPLEKVHQLFAKTLSNLEKEQEDENDEHDRCKADIQANDMDQMKQTRESDQLTALGGELKSTVEEQKEALNELNRQIAELQESLQSAGEDRIEQNQEFQQVVADQQATAAILKKALDKLREFYESKMFLQKKAAAAHGQEPPPMGVAHKPAGGAFGVISTIEMVIQEAELAEKEAETEEQKAEEAYAQNVKDASNINDALNKAVEEKTAAKAKTQANKLIQEKDLSASKAMFRDFELLGHNLHGQCDFLIDNYKLRLDARMGEIKGLRQANEILAGSIEVQKTVKQVQDDIAARTAGK